MHAADAYYHFAKGMNINMKTLKASQKQEKLLIYGEQKKTRWIVLPVRNVDANQA